MTNRPDRPWTRGPLAAAAAAMLIAASCLAHPDHGSDEQSAPPTPGAALPPSRVEIVERDGYRHIIANGLPDHATGAFPNRGNPNAIQPQRYHFRVTLTPQVQPTPRPYDRQPFGVAVNGVVFDPFTAGFWRDDPDSGWREAADPNRRMLGIDGNAAHVQPNGAYHYHGIPSPLIRSDDAMTLIGWAADGFPIYGPLAHTKADDASSPLAPMRSSYRLKAGERPAGAPRGPYDGTYDQDYEYVEGLGELDECNGRFGVTPQFPHGTYYYVVTADYPWVPRLFRGTPDPSFDLRPHLRRAPANDRRPPPRRR